MRADLIIIILWSSTIRIILCVKHAPPEAYVNLEAMRIRLQRGSDNPLHSLIEEQTKTTMDQWNAQVKEDKRSSYAKKLSQSDNPQDLLNEAELKHCHAMHVCKQQSMIGEQLLRQRAKDHASISAGKQPFGYSDAVRNNDRLRAAAQYREVKCRGRCAAATEFVQQNPEYSFGAHTFDK